MNDTPNKEKGFADLTKRIQDLFEYGRHNYGISTTSLILLSAALEYFLYFCPPHEVDKLLKLAVKEGKASVKDLKNQIREKNIDDGAPGGSYGH